MASEKCNCDICKEDERVDAIIAARDVDELIKLVNQQRDKMANIDDDLDYHKCILNGSWPSAVEILGKALERAKKLQNRVYTSKCPHCEDAVLGPCPLHLWMGRINEDEIWEHKNKDWTK
jgi:hypothetical protein